MSALQIEQKIKQLPGYLLPEVMDDVDFLLYKHGQPAQKTRTFAFLFLSKKKRLIILARFLALSKVLTNENDWLYGESL